MTSSVEWTDLDFKISVALRTTHSWYSLNYNWPPNSDLLLNNALLELIYFLIIFSGKVLLLGQKKWYGSQNVLSKYFKPENVLYSHCLFNKG